MDPHDQAAFDRLQQKLVPLWQSLQSFNQDEQTIVVVPSADVDFPLTPTEMQAYEERYLFLLLLLRQPRARLIYVTGQAINPQIIDYYFDLMPGVIGSHARRRLFLVSPLEGSGRPLTAKLLDRPRLIRRIRSLIPDLNRAHLVPFATTWADRELAMRIGIPMYGADPRLLTLGTKSEGRRLFAEEGVDHPAGYQHLKSEADLVEALTRMRAADPDLRKVVVKLDEGVSGASNAVLDLAGVPPVADPGFSEGLAARVPTLKFEQAGMTYSVFLEKLAAQGGVVEEMVEGAEVASPSVQMRVTPLGEVEVLSTHDQLLGGPSGQSFLGSRFPARPEYAQLITERATIIGRRLAKEGVLGRFALDFVVCRTGAAWSSNAIEINLRKGGTTHPYLTLQFLTGGSYNPASGLFTTPSGLPKYYIASDHVEGDDLRVLTPEDLFDMAVVQGLHFDQTKQTGVVFHMISALPDRGRVGITAVGDSPEEAEERYQQAVAAVHAEAAAARAGA
jgi:hypothetical protein